MTTYWCELAWLGDVEGAVEHGVAITVNGDRITGVESGATAAAGDVRLRGLTIPGIANGHSHAFHRALRGRTHGDAGSFWTWRDTMYALADRLEPDSYRDLATATFAEMVLAGFTSVGEFHYLHHGRRGDRYAEPNAMGEALLDAAATAGIRITLLDTCYLRAGIDAGIELNHTQMRFSDGDVDAWALRADQLVGSDDARIGAAIHSVRSVPAAAMPVVAEWATSRGAVLHPHVSEQPAENEQCLARNGRTPVELLDARGVLNDRFTAVHATHLNDHDVALVRSSNSTCCICPTTERDLADGIGPTEAFQAAGVAMSIGSDSHAVIDPFEETRAIELDHRLASLRRGTHGAGQLLQIATASGCRSLGWKDAGRLASGALADFVTVSLTSPRLAGTDPIHAAAAVVFAATASDVQHVVVGGKVIVADGVHQSIDVGAELARTIAAVWS
ncbi:MAG TPA: formimidoylglutamate deiminase [Ilumatobacteraceae bacterium]|nr:formimidoylglutamate deiminase [Ilumatobacteraceae bacterium]